MRIGNFFADPGFKRLSDFVTKVNDVTVTGADSGGEHLVVMPTSDASGHAAIEFPFTTPGTYEFHVRAYTRDTSVGSRIDNAWIRVGYIGADGKWAWLANISGLVSDQVVSLTNVLTVPDGVQRLRFEVAAGKKTGCNTSITEPVLCTSEGWQELKSYELSVLSSSLMPIIEGGESLNASPRVASLYDWRLAA